MLSIFPWSLLGQSEQRLHGSDQEDMEFNIKIDGRPLGGELNVSFLQSMQQLLVPLFYGSKLSIRCCSKSSINSVYHSIGPDLFRTPISFSSYGVLIPGLNKAVNCSINSGQVDIMKNKQM